MAKILDAASKLPTKERKFEYLRSFLNNPTMKEQYWGVLCLVIQGAYHPNVEWLLPRGNVPFKPLAENSDTEYVLYREVKRGKLNLFCKGGADNLNQSRRETLFIQLLESIPSDEARLLIAVKDKYIPFEGLSYEFFAECFPGMLPERESPKPFPVVPITSEKAFSIEVGELPKERAQEIVAKAISDVDLEAYYQKRVAEEKAKEPKEPHVNKGKKWFNDGVKNFLENESEGLAKGLSTGRVLNKNV